MNILFRADSSSTIGTGHIMRDLVLAEQFKDANIIFATQDLPGKINHKIEEKDYTIVILNSNDIEELDTLIKKLNINMIVIDHYGIDYNFEKQLKIKNQTLKIMSLDDTYEKHYCDILLNHNVYADESRYKGLVPEDCELRCGPVYTLLRDEFYRVKKYRTVLLSMGGVDYDNLNIKILEVLKFFKDIKVILVTTRANQNLEDLKEYVEGNDWIDIHINTNRIASLMKQSDFAIVTPSVTVNEIIYMETPFIAIRTADNQDDMYHYLLKNGFLALKGFNASELQKSIMQLLEPKLIHFTDMSLSDKKMILEWRNDDSIRKWMFTNEIISLDNHLRFIDALTSKKDRLYFLVQQNYQSIGIIDFTNINHETEKAEFGVYAKPGLKGVGEILMKSIIEYAFTILKINNLVSEVFEDNTSAIKLYKKFKFVETRKRDNIIVMELKNENR